MSSSDLASRNARKGQRGWSRVSEGRVVEMGSVTLRRECRGQGDTPIGIAYVWCSTEVGHVIPGAGTSALCFWMGSLTNSPHGAKRHHFLYLFSLMLTTSVLLILN